MTAVLTRFTTTLPPYEIAQQESLAWLAAAHAAVEDDPAFGERIARVMARCACPPTKIAHRRLAIADLANTDWDNHAIYDLRRNPHGPDSGVRTKLYSAVVDRYFAETYAEVADADAPDDLIHVTCTGYASPSGAQRMVAERRWPTRVTHAYQMGCYAAVPALRIAAGFLADRETVHIAHTELCSLHFDPTDHALDQLVVQSLFADGLIRYAMVRGPIAGPGLRVRAIHEVILPDSADAMSWTVGGHGMQMTLSRDVPQRIAGVLRGFVLELCRRGGIELPQLRDAAFAVHPGGPKIIDGVRDVLELAEPQVRTSREVLRDRGNMSSATLPHIWARMLDDASIPRGALIPSLAFGPGLTICGVLLEKQ